MNCNNCKEDKNIVNKHFKLCLECNNIRLHGSKYGKNYSDTTNKKIICSGNKRSKSLFVPIFKTAIKETLKEDEEFYEECFNDSNHKCEECGEKLPNRFRDDNGKVIARWRYSHIIAKSIAPELRHNINNVNHLCLFHHTQWDFGDKRSMKIYDSNKKRLPQYLN